MIQIIGEGFEFKGYPAGSFRPDLPASVRAELEAILESAGAQEGDDMDGTISADGLAQELGALEVQLEEFQADINDMKGESETLKEIAAELKARLGTAAAKTGDGGARR